jgi:peptidoglycan/xylan/chitin deacetylase (PgdA/CDA1 family)
MSKVIVTTSWDDGYKLDLKLADLLWKYGIQATFYIAPQNREFAQEQLLNAKQIRILSQKFEIGAHTLTHPHLSDLESDTAYSEIVNSKNMLEQTVSKTVSSFCYPAGLYTLENISQVKMAGFKLARTTKRFSTYPLTKPFELATTVHVYNHFFNPSWDRLAIDLFDKVLESGGIYHLWGHSWEIEKYHDWQKLEKVFRYIGKKNNVSYLTNQELL